jgi:hypothetical protein
MTTPNAYPDNSRGDLWKKEDSDSQEGICSTLRRDLHGEFVHRIRVVNRRHALVHPLIE